MLAVRAQVETGEFPSRGQSLAQIEPAIRVSGMIPGLAGHLDTVEFRVFGGIGREQDAFASVGHRQDIPAESQGSAEPFSEPFLGPGLFASERVHTDEILPHTLAIEEMI